MKYFLLPIVFALFCYGDGCSSCRVVSDINTIVKEQKDIDKKQIQIILNIKNLNTNYLMHTLVVVFELNREVKLMGINQQIELIQGLR